MVTYEMKEAEELYHSRLEKAPGKKKLNGNVPDVSALLAIIFSPPSAREDKVIERAKRFSQYQKKGR